MIQQRAVVILPLIMICAASLCQAGVFSDDFNMTASPLWGNELGNWSASSGVYRASAPSNFPSAHSSLPYDITDFTVDVDVNAADGGVWLRSASSADAIGRTGVLLVTLGSTMYWHNVSGSGSYGASLNTAAAPSSTYALRIEVSGNTYSAFANGNPITSLTTGDFSSGRVALYSNATSYTFDNFVLEGQGVPEPSTFVSLGVGFLGMIFRRQKCRPRPRKRGQEPNWKYG